jgi:hypothetical protein
MAPVLWDAAGTVLMDFMPHDHTQICAFVLLKCCRCMSGGFSLTEIEIFLQHESA